MHNKFILDDLFVYELKLYPSDINDLISVCIDFKRKN